MIETQPVLLKYSLSFICARDGNRTVEPVRLWVSAASRSSMFIPRLLCIGANFVELNALLDFVFVLKPAERSQL